MDVIYMLASFTSPFRALPPQLWPVCQPHREGSPSERAVENRCFQGLPGKRLAQTTRPRFQPSAEAIFSSAGLQVGQPGIHPTTEWEDAGIKEIRWTGITTLLQLNCTCKWLIALSPHILIFKMLLIIGICLLEPEGRSKATVPVILFGKPSGTQKQCVSDTSCCQGRI